MKTAIEWLVQELNLYAYFSQIEQAKEMEKQNIIDAYEKGDKYKLEVPGEQYYNETFNK